jgi:hypothetical protein
VQHAGLRGKGRLEGQADPGIRRFVEGAIAPPHLQKPGDREPDGLGPRTRRDVVTPHHDAGVPAVADDVDGDRGLAGFRVTVREGPETGGPKQHRDEECRDEPTTERSEWMHERRRAPILLCSGVAEVLRPPPSGDPAGCPRLAHSGRRPAPLIPRGTSWADMPACATAASAGSCRTP